MSFRTIKLPIQMSTEDFLFIKDLQRQYSSMFRTAYNRYMDGLSEKDIRLISKDLGSIENLNSWLIQCSILDAKSVFTRFNLNKDKTINPKHVFLVERVFLDGSIPV